MDKNCLLNVNEIITTGQFHQDFTSGLLRWYSFDKKLQSQSGSREKLWKHFCTKNLLIKCWCNCYVGSISPTFHRKLLLEKIPKAKKDRQLDCIFCAFGIWVCVKCWWNHHRPEMHPKYPLAVVRSLDSTSRDGLGSGWNVTDCESCKCFFSSP